jgi:hypothetical protein
MKYVVYDNMYTILAIYRHRQDAIDNVPSDGYVGVTLHDKETTQQRTNKLLTLNLTPYTINTKEF